MDKKVAVKKAAAPKTPAPGSQSREATQGSHGAQDCHQAGSGKEATGQEGCRAPGGAR